MDKETQIGLVIITLLGCGVIMVMIGTQHSSRTETIIGSLMIVVACILVRTQYRN